MKLEGDRRKGKGKLWNSRRRRFFGFWKQPVNIGFGEGEKAARQFSDRNGMFQFLSYPMIIEFENMWRGKGFKVDYTHWMA